MSSVKFAPRAWFAAPVAALAIAVVGARLFDYHLRYRDPAFSYYWYWASGYARGDLAIWRDCSYPPPFLAMFVPFTWLDPRLSWWIWQTLQIAALAAALMLFIREREESPDWKLLVIGLSLAFVFPQTLGSLYDAQPTPLLLLLLVLGWINSRRGRSPLAGLCLAAAASLKLYPAAVGGYFLFRQRWREILWAAVGVGLIIPLTGLRAWYGALFLGAPFYLNSRFWMGNERAVSLLQNACALIDRVGLSPAERQELGLPTIVALTAALLIVGAAAALTLISGSTTQSDGLCFGLWLILLPLLSPVAWSQYAIVALPVYLVVAIGIYQTTNEFWSWRDSPRLFRTGVALLGFAIAGFTLPAFWGTLRSVHFYFFAMVASYLGTALCLYSSSYSSPNLSFQGSRHESTSLEFVPSMRERRLESVDACDPHSFAVGHLISERPDGV